MRARRLNRLLRVDARRVRGFRSVECLRVCRRRLPSNSLIKPEICIRGSGQSRQGCRLLGRDTSVTGGFGRRDYGWWCLCEYGRLDTGPRVGWAGIC